MQTIAIVEDNVAIRELYRSFLDQQEGFECKVALDTVEELLDQMRHGFRPEVVLMDIDLPGMSGIDGMKLIKRQYPETEIMMLTIYHDSHKIFDSLCAGASGYLLKHSTPDELKEAIMTLLSGGAPMSPQIARKVITYFNKPPVSDPDPDHKLTSRELEIIQGLVDGLSYKLIADRMDISIDTVRAHIRNIYKKLHVNSKAEVIAKSLRGEI
jgi:DNA-binding NarL/FixJ family response regulator